MIQDMAGVHVASPPEHRVLLRNISWETYGRLLEEHLDCASPRLTSELGRTLDSVAWPDEVLKRFGQIHLRMAPGEEHS